MSRRDRRATTPPRPTVSVCRGCCCGTQKIVGVDHAGLLAAVRGSFDGIATVRVVDCLDACDQADVVVVQPSAEGRRAGGRPVWLGLVNDTEAIADIAGWVAAGGPGLVDPPGILDLYEFRPSRRVRQELAEDQGM